MPVTRTQMETKVRRRIADKVTRSDGTSITPFHTATDVQAAINSASALLPNDLPSPPTYAKANPADAPILTLALPQIAVVARMTRAAMIEVLRSNHIRTLRANGLPLSVIVRHALRGAALPVVSYLGPAAAALLTGSVVVETIFGIPGVGRYFVEGALNRDYTLVMGTVVMIAVFVLFFNMMVDIVYALVDPRVRYE